MSENKEPKKKPVSKGRDYSELLIWSAALVTVVRYAAAFIASDAGEISGALSKLITDAMGLSGLGMGFLDVFGGAYLFDGLRRAMPANDQKWPFRFKVLAGLALSLVLNGILILIPFTMSRVAHVSMLAILGDGFWLFGWAVVVNVAPYILIAGVALGNQVVNVKKNEPASEPANEPANGSRTVPEEEKKTKPESRTYKSLTDAEKYYILNTDSKISSKELGVTPRAVQKWRLQVQEEIKAGTLLKGDYAVPHQP